MKDNKKQTKTEVKTVDVNIDEILGIPGGDSVMTPAEEEPKKTVFSSNNIDTNFLNEPPTASEKTPKKPEPGGDDEPENDDEPGNKGNDKKINNEELDDLLQSTPGAADDDEDKNRGGRPTAFVSATKQLIEKGVLLPFDDDKDIADYTQEEYEELIEANFNDKQEEMRSSLSEELFKEMPEELQKAYAYVANGGTDIKGMFQTLATAQELADIDISTEDGQRSAIRTYLYAKEYGTAEQIEDEIRSLEDRGELEKKAQQFKPQLDKYKEDIVESRLKEQENNKKLREKQSQTYIENVFNILDKDELNGLKLDNKIQNKLYSGLVQTNYTSVTGKQTNLLGHLLEKYQWVEPRHDLIAEALWLLSDPEDYKKNLSDVVGKQKDAKTLKTLKTEQNRSKGGSTTMDDGDGNAARNVRKIKKEPRNIFKRK